jgi:signal peptidase I
MRAGSARRGWRRLPRDRGTDYIKRIVGTSGDRVQMRGGSSTSTAWRWSGDASGVTTGKTRAGRCAEFAEIMAGGRQYRILTGDQPSPMDDTAELVVPPAHDCVLGDNHDNSLDSRDPGFGLAADDDIVGRLAIVFWSRSHDRGLEIE